MKTLLVFFLLSVQSYSFYDHYAGRPYGRFNNYAMLRSTLRHRESRPVEKNMQYRYFNKLSHLRQGETTLYEFTTKQPITNKSMDMAFFPTIENRQIGATEIENSTYLWIAAVFHSPIGSHTFLCTAVCLQERIFVTAARCIAQGQVMYMNVRYQNTGLQPIALVIPSETTKQMHNDIGLIVVDRESYTGKWNSIVMNTVYDISSFTNAKDIMVAVVGFVEALDGTLKLYEISGKASMFLCYELYMDDNAFGSYFVPCYHSCDLNEASKDDEKCNIYLAGEGHVAVGLLTKTLVGIATWGASFDSATRPLPVGMAIPIREKRFEETLECAKTIRNADKSSTGQYEHLCNSRRLNVY